MAPTICDDNMEPCSYQNSIRFRNRSVISYVGSNVNRENEPRIEADSSEEEYHRRGREFVPYSTERRNAIKRIRRENRMSLESDDSTNSIPSPMTFHNYAKRRRFSDSEDESDKDISTSSDSCENSISSSFNGDSRRENMRAHYSSTLPMKSLSPCSPVSSTTGTMSLFCRYSKSSPRNLNPFYRQDLMEIAMKTIILLQKNRNLHDRLNQLKLETSAFVNSVMANPENAKLRQTISNEKSVSKVLGVKNQ